MPAIALAAFGAKISSSLPTELIPTGFTQSDRCPASLERDHCNEKAHAKALAATLAKKFPAHIPEEIFPRVVAFWAHAGFYASAAAVAARAAETNPRTNQGNLLRNLCGGIDA